MELDKNRYYKKYIDQENQHTGKAESLRKTQIVRDITHDYKSTNTDLKSNDTTLTG